MNLTLRWHKIGRKNRKYSNRTTRPSDQNRILASKEGIADINLQWEGRSSRIIKSNWGREREVSKADTKTATKVVSLAGETTTKQGKTTHKLPQCFFIFFKNIKCFHFIVEIVRYLFFNLLSLHESSMFFRKAFETIQSR